MNSFLKRVIREWKKVSNQAGFIPIKRLEYDYAKGKFYYNENGFILIGSLKSEITPIHIVLIYPEKRNGSTDKVLELLRLLPEKKYRVRCYFGQTFWKRCGLKEVRIDKANSRKKFITVLEGELAIKGKFYD